MIWPSSLWKESTVRVPLMESSFWTRSSTAFLASTTRGWSSGTFSYGAFDR